ncbi:lipocalin family protein [Elizabethkingia sp. M8]|uniref:lipocalin family protein n=1 Tax=Elizabethkingia sp. M8 TaxID=2796140 RepID=UPI001903D727|nr:lipocalin family protein [Elizabethkingia sp. M8]QQM26672.1 lipocalin family protein [Elizabethkingia sp. M8]
MKKILLTTLAIGLLVSCRKDDENNNNNDAVSITGTWKIVKTEIVSGKDKQKVLETKIHNDCEKKSTFEYTADGKYNILQYDYFNGACNIDEQSSISYTYNSTTKKLAIKYSEAEVYEANVEQLTKNKLQALGEYDGDYDKDGTKDYERIYLER